MGARIPNHPEPVRFGSWLEEVAALHNGEEMAAPVSDCGSAAPGASFSGIAARSAEISRFLADFSPRHFRSKGHL
ncbi:MAG: hypothetical protein EBS01_03850 [Verrucomicrobia bacterium]|nr:hypothetical protein [Verrucomicrobiota bacterium]